MLGNTTSNFNNLMGSLCRLNHNNSARQEGRGMQQANTLPANNAASGFSNSIDNTNSGLASSFGGFQQDIGQRYSMSNEQTIQMLQMLLNVLEELMGVVVNNTQGNNGNGQSSASLANGVNSVGGAQPVDSTGTFGSEATQSSKTGGCPFMAMEPQQGGAGNNIPVNTQQNINTQVQPQPSTPANNQNTPAQPAAPTNTQGVEGGSGDQSNEGVPGAGNVDKADSRDVDFSNLSKAERTDMGLDDRERAIIHLWGRQMISAGEQNGGIYMNVLGADGTGAKWGNKEEVALVKELRAQEQERFGNDTGWMLDEAYFEVMREKTGVDMSTRYANRPVNESKGPITITNDIQTLEETAGISGFEQGVLRLMGHDALMDGEFDGSVLEYTAGNANSLDSNKHSGGNSVDDTAKILLKEDKSDDGQVNGSSIMRHTLNTLDRLYA